MIKSTFLLLEGNFEKVLGSFFLLLMAACIMIQVILRFIFSTAAPWAEEITIYSMIISVYMGASLAVREKSHIRIFMLINRFPRKVALIFLSIGDFCSFIFLSTLFYHSCLWVNMLFHTKYTSIGLGVERRWPELIVPTMCAVMILRLLARYYLSFTGKETHIPEGLIGRQQKGEQ